MQETATNGLSITDIMPRSAGADASAPARPPAEGIPFGNIHKEPIQEAVGSIRFDFNDGLRVKFPKGMPSYRGRFVDFDNIVTLYETVTPPGGDMGARSSTRG